MLLSPGETKTERQAKRAVNKRMLRKRRKEQAGPDAITKEVYVPRNFLFDWRCQDVEAWREQKAKD